MEYRLMSSKAKTGEYWSVYFVLYVTGLTSGTLVLF